MKRTTILTLFLLTLTSCAGQITGHVFLDKNANSQRDQDEPTLGKILYNVTVDGTVYKNGVTDDNGLFLVPRDEDGDYCINIKSSASSYLDSATQPVITVPPSSTSKALTDTSSTAQPITESTTTTDNTTSQDKEKKDEKKDEKKEEAKKPEPPLPGPKSLQGCVRVKGYSSSYLVDIPVAIDMQSSKANIPEPQEANLSTNEAFELLIYYPRMCKLMDIQLPSYVVKPQFSGSSPLLELSKLTPDTSQSIKPYILTDDVLVPVSMKLSTVATFDGESKTFEIEPKAICPDDTVLTLPKHKFTVKKGAPLSISRKLSGKVGFGETLTLTATVKNSSSAEFNKGATLVITLPEFSNVESIGTSDCRNLIQQVECDVDYIDPSSNVSFVITFKLPEGKSITFDYSSKIQTELKFDDGSDSIKESEIPVTIPKPVE